MNTNQFTQKTMEALQRAQQIAVEYQHMQVDEEHMLLSLTEDAKALIPQLLTRCGISVDAFRAALNDALSRIPRVYGRTGLCRAGCAQADEGHTAAL